MDLVHFSRLSPLQKGSSGGHFLEDLPGLGVVSPDLPLLEAPPVFPPLDLPPTFAPDLPPLSEQLLLLFESLGLAPLLALADFGDTGIVSFNSSLHCSLCASGGVERR